VKSQDHDHERPHITTSGTDSAPIQIRALGEVRTSGFVIEASHILLDGFTVSNQGRRDKTGRDWGIYLAGTGLRITNNVVLDTEGYGISCETYPPSCFDTVIAGNIVQGADGTGILAAGERILVENNDVSRSIMVDETDADGMRFFGSEITFRKNYIHDIFDRGYPADNNPHTDCFQTFDKDKPASRAIVIENNVCLDVDHQCLIVEALDKHSSSSFKFRNNICGNNGSQAILLRGVADVEISNNLFLPSILYHGVVAQSGTTGLIIANNVFVGSYQAYDVEADSRQGLTVDYNLVYDSTRLKPSSWWAEPHGKWGVDPMFTSATGGPEPGNYRPAPGSPLIDAGSNSFNDSKEDLDSRPRVFDGDGDGTALVDIGPYEFDSK
jgi:Right handed beta helix region